MFGEMRRKKQALPLETCEKILERGTSGVLALEGEEGYPYAVPLSYFYENQKLIFHCARNGYKIEAIKRNEKASFCVIDQDRIVSEEKSNKAIELARKERNQRKCRKNHVLAYSQNMHP